MTARLFLILLFFFPYFLNAQSLKGIVLDSETGKPIDAAYVFFTNTTYGTLSQPDGTFTLEAPMGQSELVVSHISYKLAKRTINYTKAETKERTFRLAQDAKNLEEITVTSKQDKRWRKDLKKFKKMFFGSTKNAAQCEILNPTVLQFEKKEGIFKANASDLLKIKNESLGYTIYFLLEHFEAEGPQVSYAGKPFFETIKPDDKKQQKIWEKKRQLAYQGSLPHFMHALINNRLKKEGFELKRARLKSNKTFAVEGIALPKELIQEGKKASEKKLSFSGFLQVVYLAEKDQSSGLSTIGNATTKLGHPAEKDMIEQDNSMSKGNLKSQTSYLFARKNNIPIDTSGYTNRPELLVEYGYWNKEGIADMVPRNFRSNVKNAPDKNIQDAPPSILGFEMTNLQIPYEEIKKGGPKKDGIPSINQPKFVSLDKANDFLSKDDVVIGLEINGLAKAYPIRILNFHEIVNDTFEKEAVVITYCPLCNSGAAFSAMIDNQKHTFGVSGLLYNSDVLLYDHQTESLWSQISSQAVSGASAKQSLKLLSTEFTTLENWSSKYPNTLVLSTDTGEKRDYASSPYTKYETSQKLMFPVSKESDVLQRKEKVIGIEVDGKFKAYSFKKLRKSKKPIKDTFNGKKIIIEYDRTAKSARILNDSGDLLPSITLYWFAWYTFHPDTKVY